VLQLSDRPLRRLYPESLTFLFPTHPAPPSGSRFGADCAQTTAMLGSSTLSLVFCNTTLIVSRTPAGAGVLGSISVVVASINAAVSGAASTVFSYAAPNVTALVSGDV
jgi:hypothetical protein